MLKSVAVDCSVCCSARLGFLTAVVLHTATHTATYCNRLQQTATDCNILPPCICILSCHCTALFRSTGWQTRIGCLSIAHCNTHRNILQHTVAYCNTLQHIATHCNLLQHTSYHTAQHSATHTATHCKIKTCSMP